MAILFQHIEGKATPIHELDSKIDPAVSQLVQKMMAAEAKNRLQTMKQVSEAIKNLLEKL